MLNSVSVTDAPFAVISLAIVCAVAVGVYLVACVITLNLTRVEFEIDEFKSFSSLPAASVATT